MNKQTLLFFLGLLWMVTCLAQKEGRLCGRDKMCKKAKQCMKTQNTGIVVDNFTGVLKKQAIWKQNPSVKTDCIIFLQKNTRPKTWSKKWLHIETKDGDLQLYISKWHIRKNIRLTVLNGECKNETSKLTGQSCDFNQTTTGPCQARCLHTEQICDQASFDGNTCLQTFAEMTNRYIINLTRTDKNCLNCNTGRQKTEKELGPDEIKSLGVTLNPAQAVNVMEKMGDLAALINTSSAALDLGEGVTGILLKEEPEDIHEVSFAYSSPNGSIWITEGDSLAQFSRSVTVPKEAFEQAVSSNTSGPFVAMLRFFNLEEDEMNSTLLGKEVIGTEMGSAICNLTDKITINYWNLKYEGTPSCQSWNSNGSRPKWTDDGCETLINGTNITCQCSHLTFFAVLLTPLNQTITSSDLKNLTIITQVGCSLSMLFLGIILFMHYLVRKTKASTATKILMQLCSSMFLLDFTFLINHYVAKLKSSGGCLAMAAAMHYFLLATFTWFAVQAFNFCLQMHSGGKIVIKHYIAKVCIISWGLPVVVGIALLATGKYGEQVINTDNPEENVAICWMTDSDVHYIVNIGYYAVVFLFTSITSIIILTELFYLKRTKAGSPQSGKTMMTILGLCCMFGITWGFAFFANGSFLIPAYYIFTVLNSFQGFFLFIYYHKTAQVGDINSGRSDASSTNTSNISTLSTQDGSENPYWSLPVKR